jgi:hypothetical protein
MKKLTATLIAALAIAAAASPAGHSFGDCPRNAVCGAEITP